MRSDTAPRDVELHCRPLGALLFGHSREGLQGIAAEHLTPPVVRNTGCENGCNSSVNALGLRMHGFGGH